MGNQTFLFRLRFASSLLTPLSSPSSSVSLSYLILAVPMRECWGERSCMSSPFRIAVLNGKFFSFRITTWSKLSKSGLSETNYNNDSSHITVLTMSLFSLSFLLFACATVREHTRAWVHFLFYPLPTITFFHTLYFVCLYLLKTYLVHCDFILAVPMRECPGGHWCMSSTFPIDSLNGTCFFWQCNCKICIRWSTLVNLKFCTIQNYTSVHLEWK